MTDRWQEINRIYDAALELAEGARPAFLETNCQGDEELRREVESLLAYDPQAQKFINQPALQMTAEKMAAEPPSLVGRKLGPYQILGVLGAGGMGEVFTARDTRLNRTVAIKVLPRLLSERAELRQRFEREARAIASLSHPNICALHDIGRQDGIDFMVMEYLEGETLSQRLRRGPLPTPDVLSYSIEIAGALRAAHRKGVTHRDVKPGNIMLTEAGAKLLDFGLAKHTGGAGALRTLSNARGSARSTQSESLTGEGMILGTLEYMAPEQLEGKEADPRTDLFALGVVIYEMATGQKAFEGDSKASLIAKILTFQPPPIKTVQPVSPPELDLLVQKCLAKKPEERWQSAEELTSQLQQIAEANLEILKAQKPGKEPSGQAKEIESKAKPTVPVPIPEPRKVFSRLVRSRGWKLSFFGILLAVIAGSLALWRLRQQPAKQSEKPKEMSLKPLTSYAWDNPLLSAAISPDGKYLAFCLKGKLLIQVIRTGEKRPLALPEWFSPADVSWFPEGTKLLLIRAEDRWVQVKGKTIQLSEQSLWSVSILGGTPQKVADHALFPSVSPDGSLVAFGRYDPERQAGPESITVDLWLVGANGERPRMIQAASGPHAYINPEWSTNGQRLFYLRWDAQGRVIESCDIRGENVTTIFSAENRGLNNFCWAPDGRILFPLAEVGSLTVNLWEIKVDPATGKPIGEARPFTQWSGRHLSYANNLSITADGKQLALLRTNAQADVYVAELEPGGKTMKTPRNLTQDQSDDAVWDWTADSRAVLFESNRNGNFDLFKQDINQTEAETIVAGPESESHPNLSPDRAFVLYLVSAKPQASATQMIAPATRLMRIPGGGGPPELVLTGEKIKNFSCAREAKLCVVVEEVNGKQVLTAFDPLKGRGEKLPQSDYPDFAGGILSPQGRLIDEMKQGPAGLHIRVRSLIGANVEEITFKNLLEEYQFLGWSVDGKGIYLGKFTSSLDFTALYAGLDGRSQVLWKRGSSPGHSINQPIPSPDGRYLAFTSITAESNAWLLENF